MISDPIFTIALCLIVAVGVYGVRVWVAKALHRKFSQRDSKGRQVPMSALASTGLVNLPLDLQIGARAGGRAVPEQGITSVTLRTTPGLRIISCVASGLVLFYLWGPLSDLYAPPMPWMTYGITAAVLYAIVNVFAFEVRYDDHTLHVPTLTLTSREYLWRDLVRVEDDGHYLYKLRFSNGQRANVMKHMTGIQNFLSRALDRVEDNTVSGKSG